MVERRSALSHTWLKRRLLSHLATERGAWLALEANAPLPSVLRALPTRIAELEAFAAEIVGTYSPARVLEQAPLRDLPSAARIVMADVVHEAYDDLGVIQPLGSRLQAAIAEFAHIAHRVALDWFAADPQTRNVLLDELAISAELLRNALDALPDEMPLP